MCGLVGFWSYRPASGEDLAGLRYGLARIANRGPEGTAINQSPDFNVAHAQLTFHEPGKSDQPFVSSCGRYVVVFNGEIYNYGELRESLISTGYSLDTRSEAEVILSLYLEHGETFPTYLRGMFAIVIRDRAKNRVVLARDYIGKKPLYFLRDDRGLYFASELTALSPFLRSRDLDPVGFTSFFLMNAVDSRSCLISGVTKIGPGEVVVAGPNGYRTVRYWSPAISFRQHGDGTIGEELTRLLRRAVARRLLDNGVQLGLMLSGGLDSSLVAALVAEQGHALPSFSARFVDAGFDETPHAVRVAKRFCASHEVIEISDDILPAAIDHYFGQVDEPIADPSFIAVALVAAAARNSCKGLLTGDGADDLFFGYAFFRAVPALTFVARHIPPRMLKWTQQGMEGVVGKDSNLAPSAALRLLSRGTRVAPEWQHAFCTSAMVPDELAAMLSPEARDLVAWPLPSDVPVTAEPMRRVQVGLIRSFLQARILTKLDRGSMASGVELRNPFLDQDVTEFALSLDTARMINRSGTKAVLRGVAESFLPTEILRRRKQGFSVPVRRLLRGPLRELLLDTLAPDYLRRQGIFDPQRVDDLLHEHLALGLDRSKPLWALLSFNLWQRGFGATRGAAVEPVRGEGERLCSVS